MANSAFTPSVLTIAGSSAATSGEKNYILSPDDNAASRWVSSGAGVTVSTSTSTLPDNITKTTSIAIARTSGSTVYAYYRFTLDQADYGKKFKIQWDQIYSGTAGDFQLQVWSNTASNYSGTSAQLTVQTAAIPAATGTWNTTVDMPNASAPYIELRIVATAGSTLYLSSVLVGPGTITQGAAISEWQSYTPTSTQGFGTPTASFYRYKRSGSSIIISVKFAAGTVTTDEARLSLPSGLTSATTNALTMVGAYARGTGTTASANQVYIENGAAYLTFGRADGTLAGYAKRQGSQLVSAGEEFGFTTGEIPVAEWAGSGTVNLGPGAQVEYAAHDGTNNVYGPGGTAVPTTSSAAVTRTVTFQYAISVDDLIMVEWAPAAAGQWIGDVTSEKGVAPLWASYNSSSEVGWGEIRQVSVTQVQIVWRRYRTGTSNWSASTDGLWRVRKAKASSPTGFGLVNANDSGLLRSYTAMSKIRLHTGNGVGSTNTAIRRFTTTVVNTGTGITYADSATLGASFTVNEAGIYAISYTAVFTTSINFGISLNSSELTTSIGQITTSNRLVMGTTGATSFASNVSVTLSLSVNDVIRAHSDAVGSGESSVPERVSFTIQRIA